MALRCHFCLSPPLTWCAARLFWCALACGSLCYAYGLFVSSCVHRARPKLKEYTAAVKEKLSRLKDIFQDPSPSSFMFDAARDDDLPLRSELFSAMQMAAHGKNV